MLRRVSWCLLLAVSSCSGGEGTDDAGTDPNNMPPVANAGVDQTALIGQVVMLDASMSTDPESAPLIFSWRLLEGPMPGLVFMERGRRVSFTPMWDGRFVFELTASDSANQARDTVELSVSCQPPVELPGITTATTTVLAEINPPPACLDYRIVANTVIPAGGSLAIMPGVSVQVAPNVSVGTNGGTLVMQGLESAPISIAGASTGPGSWRGISLIGGAGQFIHTTIEGGGAPIVANDPPTANIAATVGALLLVERSRILRSSGLGIRVDNDSTIENMFMNEIRENALGPIELEVNQVRVLGGESMYQGNGVDIVRVRGSDLNTRSTWSNLGVPYLVGETGEGSVRFGQSVQLDAGVDLRFLAGVGLEIRLPDTQFTTVGTEAAPVLLRGQADMPGAWRGLVFAEGAGGDLRFATIRNGGGGAAWSDAQGDANRANVTILATESSSTSVRLTDVELTGSTVNALWIEQALNVQVLCTRIGATQPLVPGCPFPVN